MTGFKFSYSKITFSIIISKVIPIWMSCLWCVLLVHLRVFRIEANLTKFKILCSKALLKCQAGKPGPASGKPGSNPGKQPTQPPTNKTDKNNHVAVFKFLHCPRSIVDDLLS